MTTEGTKRCTKCGATKPVDAFFRAAKYLSGRASACKACVMAAPANSTAAANARHAKWKDANREAALRSARHQNWKIRGVPTAEWPLGDWLAENIQCCGVCGSEKSPRIDHDHASGLIRGVLCAPHNSWLEHSARVGKPWARAYLSGVPGRRTAWQRRRSS